MTSIHGKIDRLLRADPSLRKRPVRRRYNPETDYRDPSRYGRTPNDQYYAHPENTQKQIKSGSAFKSREFDKYRANPRRSRVPTGDRSPAPLPPIPGRRPANQASRYYHYDPVFPMPYEGVEGGGGGYQAPAPRPSSPMVPDAPGDYGFGRPPVFVNPAPEALHPLQPLQPSALMTLPPGLLELFRKIMANYNRTRAG